ncbi:DEKNAAC103789 [Brettanomyces naardenensis]|uniref:DEKNAAC103789 n=1 Tax=Brettanomyces naardenensis TaxID=13370 RepID=A0A448YP50_BRENA|nr:DEKNAAC103789 [Brettanomyces naardenensis]
MKLFITGASGLVGSAVTTELLSHGYSILALARSDKTAETLEKKGVEVIRGVFSSPETLAAGVSQADGVIHLGFVHDFNHFPESLKTDKAVIAAILEALKGTDKPFIMISVNSLDTEFADEDTPYSQAPAAVNRTLNEKFAFDFAAANHLNVMSVRLPPTVHGHTDFRGFIPIIVAGDKKYGSAIYLGKGDNLWSAVNVADAATLIRLALEKGKPGARYNAIGESGIAFKTIAEAIGKKYGLPVKSVTPEEGAKVIGVLVGFAGRGQKVSSEKTKKELGWEVKGAGLLEDIKNFY